MGVFIRSLNAFQVQIFCIGIDTAKTMFDSAITSNPSAGRADCANSRSGNEQNAGDFTDTEKQQTGKERDVPQHVSTFKMLSWLDRLLAVWIFLAMVVGILLGNFVPQTGPALQKGHFVGVSVPIGM